MLAVNILFFGVNFMFIHFVEYVCLPVLVLNCDKVLGVQITYSNYLTLTGLLPLHKLKPFDIFEGKDICVLAFCHVPLSYLTHRVHIHKSPVLD